MPTKLQTKQEELAERQKKLAKAFELAGSDLDFSKRRSGRTSMSF
jgi:hypothetical protein